MELERCVFYFILLYIFACNRELCLRLRILSLADPRAPFARAFFDSLLTYNPETYERPSEARPWGLSPQARVSSHRFKSPPQLGDYFVEQFLSNE
jgi:hypothetical protein